MNQDILIVDYSNNDEKTKLPSRGRLLMPNGDIFRIQWNKVEEALEITKEFSDAGEALSIWPKVSNQILIK